MNTERFRNVVTCAEELTALIGTPSELVIKKQLSALDAHMKAFIAESPVLLLGTVGKEGHCDVSPRGDAPVLLPFWTPKHSSFQIDAAIVAPTVCAISLRRGRLPYSS